MKHLVSIVLGLLLFAATATISHAAGSPAPQAQSKTTAKAVHTMRSDRGQQVFEQNCSRCHNAPQGFPPSISGTVAMHMRVRANLSDADFKALLRFLNP